MQTFPSPPSHWESLFSTANLIMSHPFNVSHGPQDAGQVSAGPALPRFSAFGSLVRYHGPSVSGPPTGQVLRTSPMTPLSDSPARWMRDATGPLIPSHQQVGGGGLVFVPPLNPGRLWDALTSGARGVTPGGLGAPGLRRPEAAMASVLEIQRDVEKPDCLGKDRRGQVELLEAAWRREAVLTPPPRPPASEERPQTQDPTVSQLIVIKPPQ